MTTNNGKERKPHHSHSNMFSASRYDPESQTNDTCLAPFASCRLHVIGRNSRRDKERQNKEDTSCKANTETGPRVCCERSKNKKNGTSPHYPCAPYKASQSVCLRVGWRMRPFVGHQQNTDERGVCNCAEAHTRLDAATRNRRVVRPIRNTVTAVCCCFTHVPGGRHTANNKKTTHCTHIHIYTCATITVFAVQKHK